jgi:hypothetical protein
MPRWWNKGTDSQDAALTFIESFATKDPELEVAAEVSVRWRHLANVQPHTDPSAALRAHLRAIVGEAVGQEPATRAHAAQDIINAKLGTPQWIERTSIYVVQAHAQLIVDPHVHTDAADREQARQHARRRAEELADEIKHVEAFRSRVLADPGMAMAYWFLKNPEQATQQQALNDIESLSQKIASYDPENSWVQISLILQKFIEGLSEGDRRDSLEVLRKWLERFDGEEYLKRLPDPRNLD